MWQIQEKLIAGNERFSETLTVLCKRHAKGRLLILRKLTISPFKIPYFSIFSGSMLTSLSREPPGCVKLAFVMHSLTLPPCIHHLGSWGGKMQLNMCNNQVLLSIKYALFATGSSIIIAVESNAFLMPSRSTKISIIEAVHAGESASVQLHADRCECTLHADKCSLAVPVCSS